MAPASRRPDWIERAAEAHPVLPEVHLLLEDGVAAVGERAKAARIPQILTAASYLPGAAAARGPLDAVRALLDCVLDPDDGTWVVGTDNRLGASLLLGHDDGTFGKPLRARRRAAAAECFSSQSVDTFRRSDRGAEPKLLLAVCTAIEKMIAQGEQRQAAALASTEGRLSGQLPYVRRPALERSLAALMRDRPPSIAVAGPPSTGKRSLVARVLADSGVTSVIILDGSDPEVTRHGMAEALLARKIPYAAIGALPQYPLQSLLESDSSPEYLVIENAANSSWLDFFATPRIQATIIVTTARYLPAVDHVHYVNVGAMEPAEAVELVRTLLPAAGEADAAELARLLGHQVLAVTAACGMIAQNADRSIPEFCRNLTRNMAEVLDGELVLPGTAGQPALTQIYRQTLADLERENPQALTALELAAYLAEDTVPSWLIVLALASALGIDPGDSAHLKIIAQRAVGALRDRYLVSVDERRDLSVPSLTRTIISHLVHHRGREICAHLRNGLLTSVILTRKAAPDLPLMGLLRAHSSTLFLLLHTYIDPKKTGDLPAFVALYARAVAELLAAIEVPAWRIAVIVFEKTSENYSVTLMELPEKLAEIARPALTIDWNDPEPHRLEHLLPNWATRKAMQVVVVDRSGTAVRDFTGASDEASHPLT
jgi:hypothetical protein